MSTQTYCTLSGASCRHAFICLSLVRSGVSGCGPSKKFGFGGRWMVTVVVVFIRVVVLTVRTADRREERWGGRAQERRRGFYLVFRLNEEINTRE